jgi:hypothetical protein
MTIIEIRRMVWYPHLFTLHYPLLEVAMRRALSLLAVPAVLVLAGFRGVPAAEPTLSAEVFCNNNGGGTFYCTAYPSGGSGPYSTYRWSFSEFRPLYGTQPGYQETTSGERWYASCSVDWTVNVSVTVTDSQGATGTGSTSFHCSQWAD